MVPHPSKTIDFPDNRAVASITATKTTGNKCVWRGPIIAYAREGTNEDSPAACKDFDMIDFRAMADFFLWPQGPDGPPQPFTVPFSVLLSCGRLCQLLLRQGVA
jgi:hypothetical protein